ncbi:hypothetical protein NIASO_09145 [Niabella soli DSM 19437]|uniref:DUF6875 domain-containing protein n=1 Tax=Niabella soli DSM 19437 TaxID=929713 RepID=W0F398_9BACT|nr:hypothetical protein NIASO_09145 [Niabella soli DSM 19437]
MTLAKNATAGISLFDIGDIMFNNIPTVYAPYGKQLEGFSGWVNNFLIKPNPGLGRTGAVCPYIQYSKEQKFFKVGIYTELNPSQEHIIGLMREMKELFNEMHPTNNKDKRFKAITVLFPNLQGEEIRHIIDEVQLKLKPEFVDLGLMIGQFHENCAQPGLRNVHFRPLQAPVPLLAIRFMVETDWLFLAGDPVLEKAYYKNFGSINFGKKKEALD